MKIFSSKLLNHSFILLLGNIFAQLIPLLVISILSRFLSADLFGVFYLYVAISQTLTVISGLRIEQTIMLPKDDKDGDSLFLLSILVTVVMSVFWELLFLVSLVVLPDHFKQNEIYHWLRFIPLSIFLTGIVQSFFLYQNRYGKYKSISITKVLLSVANGLAQFAFSFIHGVINGLILGLIAGQLFTGIGIGLKIKLHKMFHEFNLKHVLSLLKKYRDIPIYNTFVTLTSTLSNQMPVMLLSFFYGHAPTGYYGNGNRLLQSPINLVTNSFGQVLFKTLSERKNRAQKIFPFLRKTYTKLFLLAIIPFTILYLFSEELFTIILGENGRITGEYMKLLIPWLFVSFLNRPLYSISIILNRQKQILVFNVISLILAIIALYIGFHWYNEIRVSLKLFGLIGILYSIAILVYYLKISRDHDKKLDYQPVT